MSRRPGRILVDLTVDLPRPRRYDMLMSQDFMTLKREVLALVRAEALAVINEP
jgi:hypothetical protein